MQRWNPLDGFDGGFRFLSAKLYLEWTMVFADVCGKCKNIPLRDKTPNGNRMELREFIPADLERVRLGSGRFRNHLFPHSQRRRLLLSVRRGVRMERGDFVLRTLSFRRLWDGERHCRDFCAVVESLFDWPPIGGERNGTVELDMFLNQLRRRSLLFRPPRITYGHFPCKRVIMTFPHDQERVARLATRKPSSDKSDPGGAFVRRMVHATIGRNASYDGKRRNRPDNVLCTMGAKYLLRLRMILSERRLSDSLGLWIHCYRHIDGRLRHSMSTTRDQMRQRHCDARRISMHYVEPRTQFAHG